MLNTRYNLRFKTNNKSEQNTKAHFSTDVSKTARNTSHANPPRFAITPGIITFKRVWLLPQFKKRMQVTAYAPLSGPSKS